jgi:hypothetical protein
VQQGLNRCQWILRTIREPNESDVRFSATACNSEQHPNENFESTEFPRRMRVYHFRITAAFLGIHSYLHKSFIMSGELAGARTQDPRLKRALLYQLSYELVQGRFFKTNTGRRFWSARTAAWRGCGRAGRWAAACNSGNRRASRSKRCKGGRGWQDGKVVS